MDQILNNIFYYISVIKLMLSLLGIHTIHTVYFTAWLEPWIMFRKAKFVFSRVHSIEYSFYRIIIGVMWERVPWSFGFVWIKKNYTQKILWVHSLALLACISANILEVVLIWHVKTLFKLQTILWGSFSHIVLRDIA